MRQNNKVKVVQGPADEAAPIEIIEKAIVDLARGMNAIDKSRLKYETVVMLLHANSGVAKATIRIILNNLLDLENLFLKPKAANGR